MIIRKITNSLTGIVVLAISALSLSASDPAGYVNPFIGTGGHGHTFPGATRPFGFVQLSPDTRIANWDGSSGYHYSDDIIYGFSHTHLSGTGIPDYCDVLFSPYVSAEDFLEPIVNGDTSRGFASRFSHTGEKAEAGYYSVKLRDEKILAELTSTKRVGFHRYTFPDKTENARFTLDLKWRDHVLDSEIRIVGDRRVEGYRRSSSWAKDQVVFFSAEFSKPFTGSKISFEPLADERPDTIAVDGARAVKARNLKAVFRFDVDKGEKVLLKVALSPVSVKGARSNLEEELAHWDFERVRKEARDDWNKELSRIEVSGGTAEQMTIFYTALYHTMIAPNIFQDADGGYRGLDGKTYRVGREKGSSPTRGQNYTVFSLWDTFRATHPLYTIIDQQRTVDFINTFIRQYEQGGKLPVWELAGNETDTMIGYHAVSVIADAMAKGITGFDYQKAFEAAKHSSELDTEGLGDYRRRGYISMEDEQESVSRTLEYAYNDYCIAVMAKILGRSGDFDKHIKRALYYRNLFDSVTGFMRPKRNADWITPFSPNEVTFNYTEANSWQYSFFVPHDVSGLMALYGGKEDFAAKLDLLFSTGSKLSGRDQPDITGLIGQYAHGNEPSHHIAYLYNYAERPWKTQFYVRKIMDEFYKNEPDGLIGNEDCGQMSAWYVLSSLGFYQVNPSDPVYALGSPIFPEARIRLENGREFVIRTAPVGSNANSPVYVASTMLNGKPLKNSYITHKQLMSGGSLDFTMTDEPAKTWFTDPPVSAIGIDQPAVPTVSGERVFGKETAVTILAPGKNSSIRFTTNGNEPEPGSALYSEPIVIENTTTVKAYAMFPDGTKSKTAEATFHRMPHDWDVSLLSLYSRQYTGGGPNGLIDGLRGRTNFASGDWQGYQGHDFAAVIDLKRETEITQLGGGFLQAARSWIWMPRSISFEVSSDGREFRKVAEIIPRFPERELARTIKDYVKEIDPVSARYVMVTAKNFGKIPAWHPGAGFEAYIFVDEIFIR